MTFVAYIWATFTVVWATISYVFGLTGDEVLYGYGPLGVFAVAAVIAIRTMFNYFLTDRDRVIEQRDQLMKDMTEKTLPLLTKTAELLEKRQILDQELITGFRDAQKLASNAERVLEDVRRKLDRMS